MSQAEDALIAAIQAGDQEAISRFCDRFRLRLIAIARKRGVPLPDCDDVAQEVLLSATRQIAAGQFRHEASLFTWLYRLLNGKIVDHLRRRPAVDLVPLEAVSGTHADLTAIERRDDVLWVRAALATLSPEEQLMIRLHDVERYTLVEIGRLIGLRKSAVGARLAQARERLRHALRGTGHPAHISRLKDV